MASWFLDWTTQPVVIVAGGPSAKEVKIDCSRDVARVVVINDSWRLAPWADVLYACDVAWWRKHNGVPEFKGLKISQDVQVLQRPEWDIRLIRTDRTRQDMVRKPIGRVGWGGHSGFHCINLAIQFGASKLILVGFDMQIEHGLHWHGAHPRGLNNPSRGAMAKWRAALDNLAPRFKEIGVEVVNCSPVSALTAFPKMDLAEALDGNRIAAAAA